MYNMICRYEAYMYEQGIMPALFHFVTYKYSVLIYIDYNTLVWSNSKIQILCFK